MSADNPRQRPYKVWNADRSTRKGVSASNLYDLIRKGKVRLDLLDVDKVQVVLEADGTEVDEEYFKQLPDHTVFLILRPGDRWYPPGVEAIRAAIHAIPRIVCDAMNTLELIDEAPSWKIMDNRGRVTVVLHWDQRDIRRRAPSPAPGNGAGTRPGTPAPNHVPSIEEPGEGASGYQGGRRSPIVITAKIDGVSLDRSGSLEYSTKLRGNNQLLPAGVASSIPVAPGKKETLINDVHVHVPGSSLDTCDFHCGVLHEEGARIHINKSVATSPIQESQQQSGISGNTITPGAPSAEARRPSPKGGAHVRFLDVQMSSIDRDSSESDPENAANEEDQLSERYLLLVDQLSVEQKRHLSIKDIGVILERLSSKIIDVERLEREKESEDIHNWTIKATIKGEVLREIGVVYNGHYYGISEHPGYF